MIAIFKFLLVLLYIVACGVLIFSVLLQQGKGATLGASLGGGASQTVFGSRTSNFVSRMTAVMAGVFMVLALVLAKWPPFGTDTSSDVQDVLTPEPVEAVEVDTPEAIPFAVEDPAAAVDALLEGAAPPAEDATMTTDATVADVAESAELDTPASPIGETPAAP